jgi:hypothetical protein
MHALPPVVSHARVSAMVSVPYMLHPTDIGSICEYINTTHEYSRSCDRMSNSESSMRTMQSVLYVRIARLSVRVCVHMRSEPRCAPPAARRRQSSAWPGRSAALLVAPRALRCCDGAAVAAPGCNRPAQPVQWGGRERAFSSEQSSARDVLSCARSHHSSCLRLHMLLARRRATYRPRPGGQAVNCSAHRPTPRWGAGTCRRARRRGRAVSVRRFVGRDEGGGGGGGGGRGRDCGGGGARALRVGVDCPVAPKLAQTCALSLLRRTHHTARKPVRPPKPQKNCGPAAVGAVGAPAVQPLPVRPFARRPGRRQRPSRSCP